MNKGFSGDILLDYIATIYYLLPMFLRGNVGNIDGRPFRGYLRTDKGFIVF